MPISEGERLRRRVEYRRTLLNRAALTWQQALQPKLHAKGQSMPLNMPTDISVGSTPQVVSMSLPRQEVARTDRAHLCLSPGAEALIFIDGQLVGGLDRFHGGWPLAQLSGELVEVVYDAGPTRQQVASVRDWQVVTQHEETTALSLDVEAALSVVRALGENSDLGLQILRALDVHLSGIDRLENVEAIRREATPLRQDIDRALAPLSPIRVGRVFAAAYSHLDASWFWTFAETRTKFRRTMANAVRYLESFPEAVFHQTQAWAFFELEGEDGALFARIRDLVAQGRIHLVGGMWVESDVHLASGETIARQLLYGQHYFFQRFGRIHRVGWLPDSFGFQASLPQIFHQGGLHAFVTPKLNLNESNRLPHNGFRWMGIDGTELTTIHYQNPLHNYDGQMEAEEVTETWKSFRDKGRQAEALLTFGHGDGGGGPTLAMGERLRRLAHLGGIPNVRQGNIDTYLKDIDPHTLASYRGELYFELTRGTYSSQARLKVAQRQAERLLQAAEEAASMASLMKGQPYPEKLLRDLWQEHCLLHFHDVLAGTVPGLVYQDVMGRWQKVMDQAQGVIDQALGEFRGPLALWAGSREFRGVIRLPSHHPWAKASSQSQADGDSAWLPLCLPAHSVQSMEPAPLEPVPVTVKTLPDGRIQVQNAYYRLLIGTDGEMQSLLLLGSSEREVLAAPTYFGFYPDRPMRSDANMHAWDVDHLSLLQGLPFAQNAGVPKVVTKGPLVVRIEATTIHDRSTLTRTYHIDAQTPFPAIEWSADWHEHERWLKWWIPLSVNSERATCDIAWGTDTRPTHSSTPWDAEKFEVYAHRFVDLSEGDFGVAIFNSDRYGHAFQGNLVGVTLLRSPISPDENADQGSHYFRLAIYPHRGAYPLGEVQSWAESFQSQPILSRAHGDLLVDGSKWFRWQGAVAELTTIKRAESGESWVVRLVERENRRGRGQLHLPRSANRVVQTTLLEGIDNAGEWTERSIEDGSAAIDFMPFQVVTLLIFERD